jgi:predicted GNAT family acetyltransferase
MHVKGYKNANDFLNETRDFLEQNEAANNVILGTCLRLSNQTSENHNHSYFASIEENGKLTLVAMMTPPFSIILYSDKIVTEYGVSLLIQDLVDKDFDVPGVMASPELAKLFSTTWSKLRGYNIIDGLNMRAYELVKVNHPQYCQGDFRVAKEEDLKIVSTWIYNLEKDEGSDISYEQAYEMAKNKINNGQLYVWEDNVPVSMACTARSTTNGIVINMVYTPPELRGKGYASSCVASLSHRLLNIGYKFCSLVTDLSNPTSNSIYVKIGYKPVCDYISYSFKS